MLSGRSVVLACGQLYVPPLPEYRYPASPVALSDLPDAAHLMHARDETDLDTLLSAIPRANMAISLFTPCDGGCPAVDRGSISSWATAARLVHCGHCRRRATQPSRRIQQLIKCYYKVRSESLAAMTICPGALELGSIVLPQMPVFISPRIVSRRAASQTHQPPDLFPLSVAARYSRPLRNICLLHEYYAREVGRKCCWLCVNGHEQGSTHMQ